jgi:hypothetical protein
VVEDVDELEVVVLEVLVDDVLVVLVEELLLLLEVLEEVLLVEELEVDVVVVVVVVLLSEKLKVTAWKMVGGYAPQVALTVYVPATQLGPPATKV